MSKHDLITVTVTGGGHPAFVAAQLRKLADKIEYGKQTDISEQVGDLHMEVETVCPYHQMDEEWDDK